VIVKKSLLVLTAVLASLGTAAYAGPPPGGDSQIPQEVVPSLYQFGNPGTGPGQLSEPSGVAVDRLLHVYVSDCALSRIQVFTESGDFLRSIGGPAASDGGLACPQGVAVDSRGSVYVVDSANARVAEYGANGDFIGYAVKRGLRSPYGIAVSGRHMVVSDPGTNTIGLYDRSGHHLKTCGTFGSSSNRFAAPLGVDLAAGSVYVADQQNAQIKRLTSECHIVKAWGTYGSRNGELAEPSDVAVVGRTAFVADTTNHRLQAFSLTGQYLYQWGRHPAIRHEGHGRTHYPQYIAVDPNARVAVVCEPFEVRCQTFDLAAVRNRKSTANDDAFWYKYPRFHYGKRVNSTLGLINTDCQQIFTLPGTQIPPVVRDLGSAECWEADTLSGIGQAKRANPSKRVQVPFRGIAISEPDTSQVLLLDWTGSVPRLIARIGGFGAGPGQFKQPAGMVIDLDALEIYIADGNNHRVEVFTLGGKFVRSFGTFGDAPGQLNGPGGMDVDADGHLLISEVHGNRIDVFTKSGHYLRSIGRRGSGDLEFLEPLSVRFNQRLNRIYVVDTFNERIQILAEDGRFIKSFGTKGIDSGQFIDPFDIAFDSQNNVYVTDTSTDRVLKFDQDGKFLTQWGSFGSEIGQFYKPKGVATLEDKVLVIDFGNHRGQVFANDGKPLGVFGEGLLNVAGDVPNTPDLFSNLPPESAVVSGIFGSPTIPPADQAVRTLKTAPVVSSYRRSNTAKVVVILVLVVVSLIGLSLRLIRVGGSRRKML